MERLEVSGGGGKEIGCTATKFLNIV